MRNIIPKNTGNSNNVVEKNSPITMFPMIRYESIFDFYSEEPVSISVQSEKEGNTVNYEQIIRVRKWGINGQCLSWSIYSTNREDIEDIVIRKVIWDMKQDKEFVQRNIRDKKQELLKNWPSILNQTNYIPSEYSEDMIKRVGELDNIIKNGILLEENINPNWEWRDLEIKRLYDWGQVHNTWSTHMRNQDVEDSINTLVLTIDAYLNKMSNKAETIYLNYSIMPSEYKEKIEGNK